MEITVRERRRKDENEDPKNIKTFVASKDLGEDLKDAVAKFGEAAIFGAWVSRCKVEIQDLVRPLLKAGKTGKEMGDAVAAHKFGVKTRTKKSAVDKALELIADMDEEKKAAILRQLKGKNG